MAPELGLALLRQVSAGEWDAALAQQLAAAVLSSRAVRLATEVLGAGPHSVDRAIELAAVLGIAAELQERKNHGAG